MHTIIIMLPLINAVLAGFFGWYLGKQGCSVISSISLTITALLSWLTYYDVLLCGNSYHIILADWIVSGVLTTTWSLVFDSLSVTMLVVVTTVSALVHIYSIGYMSEDPHICRFLSYLSFFTFFMLALILSDNLMQLFFGWEGVGLCSYLLISFWYTRIKANKAALKAVVMNRIADVFIVLALGACFMNFGTLKFDVIFSLVPLMKENQSYLLGYQFKTIDIISILLFIGAMGKSAQIGLHTWLPDAMEGPTPVSALIHAATMVTAGVFLVIRCSPLFEESPVALTIISIVGGITAFMSATIALTQHDLKKVIAYSTCSQLGYMFFSCGLSNYHAGLFHLFNHAFFKALLFLAAGSVIHAMGDEQDVRRLGGVSVSMPITYITVLIGSLSLSGFPFLSGFYSKDYILETAVAAYSINGIFVFWLGSITAFLTAFYTFRLFIMVFMQKPKGSQQIAKNSHESGIFMLIPLIILSIGSIFSGYVFRDLFIGLGSDGFKNSISVSNVHVNLLDAEFIPYFFKAIPLCFSTLGILIALLTYQKLTYYYSKLWINIIPVTNFLSKRWFFDIIYNKFIGFPILRYSYSIFFKIIDKGILEWVGPTGIYIFLKKTTKNVKTLQTGYIYTYISLIGLGIAVISILIIS